MAGIKAVPQVRFEPSKRHTAPRGLLSEEFLSQVALEAGDRQLPQIECFSELLNICRYLSSHTHPWSLGTRLTRDGLP